MASGSSSESRDKGPASVTAAPGTTSGELGQKNCRFPGCDNQLTSCYNRVSIHCWLALFAAAAALLLPSRRRRCCSVVGLNAIKFAMRLMPLSRHPCSALECNAATSPLKKYRICSGETATRVRAACLHEPGSCSSGGGGGRKFGSRAHNGPLPPATAACASVTCLSPSPGCLQCCKHRTRWHRLITQAS